MISLPVNSQVGIMKASLFFFLRYPSRTLPLLLLSAFMAPSRTLFTITLSSLPSGARPLQRSTCLHIRSMTFSTACFSLNLQTPAFHIQNFFSLLFRPCRSVLLRGRLLTLCFTKGFQSLLLTLIAHKITTGFYGYGSAVFHVSTAIKPRCHVPLPSFFCRLL